MENLLNGKNLDDIEFQPNTVAGNVKTEEFHFGPNAAPFTPSKVLDQSEAFSTKAVFDDSTTSYMDDVSRFESTFADTDISAIPEFHPKSQDPMSTSFYQDREDDSNPFDLNKVQVLPDNLDEFLNKSDDSPDNNARSDNLLEETQKDVIQEKPATIVEQESVADLLGDFQSKTQESEFISSHVLQEQDKSPFDEVTRVEPPQTEAVPPKPSAPELDIYEKTDFISQETLDAACIRPTSAGLYEEQLLEKTDDACYIPYSKSPVQDSPDQEQIIENVCLRPESKSPLLEPHYEEPVCLRPDSQPTDVVCQRPESQFVDEASSRPESQPIDDVCSRPESELLSETQSPVPAETCLRTESSSVQSPSPVLEATNDAVVIPESKSPLLEPVSQSVEAAPESKSPLPDSQSPIPEVCLRPESADLEAPSPAPSDDICLPVTKTPEPEAPTPEPLGDVCQRPVFSPEPAPVPESAPVEHVAKEEIYNETLTSPVEPITSTVSDEIASPVISPVPKEVVESPSENLNEKEIDSGLDTNESLQQTMNNLNFVQEISNNILQGFDSEGSALVPDLSSTQKSFDTESVVTADVNSMLEKCNLPDVASPLSTSDQPSDGKF